MLTQLRLKNWRSIKDATIDFTPITVLIGANSAGKTNVVDALRFWRDSLKNGLVATVSELDYTRILTNPVNLGASEPVELGFAFQLRGYGTPIIQELKLYFDERTLPFHSARVMFEGDKKLYEQEPEEHPPRKVHGTAYTSDSIESRKRGQAFDEILEPQVKGRWQLLGQHFVPPLRLARTGGDPYVIEYDARNTLVMLDFLQQVEPELFGKLRDDLRWMLGHVTNIRVEHQSNADVELRLTEGEFRAWTVSAGTQRIIAMLAAIYALDLPQVNPNDRDNPLLPSAPGLVVIEEPDTALNPGILQKFVEQIRTYVDGEYPRQFIFTTHNPRFLDYFQPEEVRVVERDEHGLTTVKHIPEHIRETWLNEYTLGEVWMTRSLGGLPE